MGLIECKYVEVKEEVTQLQRETIVSLTGDMWTSITTDAYLTLTVNFISDAWEMRSVVLGSMSGIQVRTLLPGWRKCLQSSALAPVRWLHLSTIVVLTSILLVDSCVTSMDGILKHVLDIHFSYVSRQGCKSELLK